MNKSILFIIPLLLFISCQKDPESLIDDACTAVVPAEINHNKRTALQNVLDEYVAAGIPGLTAVVHSESDGFFVGVAGNSDLSTMSQLQACNTFRVASLTKTFMATAIMQLVDAAELQLEDNISNILDEETLQDLAKANETTVRELLSHTSGIPNYDDNTRFIATILNEPGKEISLTDRLNFAKELEGTPDDVIEEYGMIYSNTNYILLQLILEKITGLRYELYIQQNILDPLQMHRTTFSTIEPYPDGLTSGYCDMFDNGKVREVNRFDANRWSGEASIISNGVDIFTFFQALLGSALTSTEALEQMKSEKLGLLTMTTNGVNAMGHDGEAVGYSTEMWYIPQRKLTVILLANQGRISSDQPSIQSYEMALNDIIALHE